mmetsp:Transcript_7732/g.21130  ORF Transcript_7732/g.21130 Transcript_7732/m.21130 type:complete len:200 (+) Transcript_7732:479-1078(+)
MNRTPVHARQVPVHALRSLRSRLLRKVENLSRASCVGLHAKGDWIWKALNRLLSLLATPRPLQCRTRANISEWPEKVTCSRHRLPLLSRPGWSRPHRGSPTRPFEPHQFRTPVSPQSTREWSLTEESRHPRASVGSTDSYPPRSWICFSRTRPWKPRQRRHPRVRRPKRCGGSRRVVSQCSLDWKTTATSSTLGDLAPT